MPVLLVLALKRLAVVCYRVHELRCRMESAVFLFGLLLTIPVLVDWQVPFNALEQSRRLERLGCLDLVELPAYWWRGVYPA